MTMRTLHHPGAPLRGSLSETGGPVLPEPVMGERHAETIQQSHERCLTMGLNRTDRLDFPTLSRNELALARERNHRLYVHAAPVMETLFSQILDSQSMVVLTDANGTILHTIGPDAFLQRAAKVALSPGVNWSESTKGTNAIGTALIEELPTLVHGAEHFINANHFLTCSAAPILDPRGNILGVLDVTGDQHTFHPYTLGLVRMSVRMIENHWFSDDHRNVGHIYLHARPEFLGTLTEGILAVNPDGRIMGANRGAQEQLGMSSAALRMHTVTSLFGATMGALTERFRSPQVGPMLVETVSGRQLHLRARFNWPVWHSLSDSTADAVEATPVATGAGGSGLSLPPASASRDAAPAPAGRAPLRTAEMGGVTGAPAPAGLGGSLGSGPTSVSSAMPPGSPFGVPSGRLADAFVPGTPGGSSGEPPRSSASRKLGLSALATGDAQMAALLDKLKRVLNRDIPVLIQGETGTGKELLARAIHQDSSRASAPFVAVNCASIPETLIESELFGYEEGAFTGARRKGAVGKMVQAHGGTLFLDEIGDMPLSLQAHLLRVLQEREVTPLGSGRAIPIDINLVCATHRNLREMIERKTFREDLYFRLNGLVVRIPPLRERTDLMLLVERILQRECPDVAHELAPDVVNLFQACRWQGNVRQLAGVLRTACVMAGDERFITRAHLSDDFMDDVLRSQSQAGLGARATAVGSAGSMAGSGYIGGGMVPPAGPAGGLHGHGHGHGQGGMHGSAPAHAYPEASAAEGLDVGRHAAPPAAAPGPAAGAPSAPASLVDIELQTIRQAVEAARGNISEAAKQLGISRNTIYRKLHWQNKQH